MVLLPCQEGDSSTLPGTSWIKPNICRFNRWRWQHVSEQFRLLFSKANSNYCNAKNREIWPQGLDLGGSTASNWRTSAQIKTLRPYFLTLIYQSIILFLFRGIIQLSKLHFDDLGPGIWLCTANPCMMVKLTTICNWSTEGDAYLLGLNPRISMLLFPTKTRIVSSLHTKKDHHATLHHL